MSKRTRIFGGQAAAVALLILLVYVTLLRPSDTGPISGIEGPGGSPPAPPPTSPDGGNGQGGPPSPPGGGGGTTVLPPAGAIGATTPLIPSGPPLDQFVSTSPPDDQYADAVTSLIRKVAGDGPSD